MDKKQKKQKRQDPHYKKSERLRQKKYYALRRAAFDYFNTPSKYLKQREISSEHKLYKIVQKKFNLILKTCSICDLLWYPISGARRKKFHNQFICNCCYSYVSKDPLKVKNKLDLVPPLSPLNNVILNKIPKELKGLNRLELRLLAPRQVFLWMHAKPISNEPYCRGNLVYVPANPQKSIAELKKRLSVPLNEGKSQIIQLELKRCLSDKKNFIAHTIRPNKVIAAAKRMAGTPLYQKYGIN